MKDFIEIAAEAAQELEEAYADKPAMEFMAWLQIALKREAMVSVAYDNAFVEGQLAGWQAEFDIKQEVIDVVRRALVGVWAQENAHQSYFRAMLTGISPSDKFLTKIATKLLEIRGKLEGNVIAGMMSPQALRKYTAQVALVVGKKTTEVPEYVSTLRRTTFSQFCNVNRELEHTAVLGYKRMVELGRSMPDLDLVSDTPVLVDLQRTGADEKYHEELFRTLGDWPPPFSPVATPPAHSPFGPVPTPSDTMSVAEARGIIARARSFAYGSQATVLGDRVMAFDEVLIFNDPLIRHLKQFAIKEVDEGLATSYMTAGA